VIPVSAPPRVRARLRAAPDGPVPVVHRGADAVYVEVAGQCVGVLGRRATAVPCGLRSRLDRLDRLDGPGRSDGVEAHVSGGVLHLGGRPLVVGRILDVRVPRLHARPAGPSVGTLDPALVASMVGRGDGLTPYGDDVLCGWLALHRAAGIATPAVDAAVRGHLGRTTLLSATLLECAMAGEALPELATFVSALGTPAEASAAAALAAVGHSSGTGLLEGARRALGGLVLEGAA
jgi:hypothetical protein